MQCEICRKSTEETDTVWIDILQPDGSLSKEVVVRHSNPIYYIYDKTRMYLDKTGYHAKQYKCCKECWLNG